MVYGILPEVYKRGQRGHSGAFTCHCYLLLGLDLSRAFSIPPGTTERRWSDHQIRLTTAAATNAVAPAYTLSDPAVFACFTCLAHFILPRQRLPMPWMRDALSSHEYG
jgi:hypothetical protein